MTRPADETDLPGGDATDLPPPASVEERVISEDLFITVIDSERPRSVLPPSFGAGAPGPRGDRHTRFDIRAPTRIRVGLTPILAGQGMIQPTSLRRVEAETLTPNLIG
jgi:hypothetical protein